jgi:hypothetical protein
MNTETAQDLVQAGAFQADPEMAGVLNADAATAAKAA